MIKSRAVMLTGGKGTRLTDRSRGMPKALAPVAGKPLLEWQFQFLVAEGIRTVLVLTGYRANEIRSYISRRDNRNLNIVLIDDDEPRGTAGAIFGAWDALDDEFLVIYGDTILNVDLSRFYHWHSCRPNAVASLLVHPNDHPADSDLVQLDRDDRVEAFLPYPRPPGIHARNLVNAALYWVRKQKLAPWRSVKIPLDFGRDLFPRILEDNGSLYGYRSPEYIKDAGTPSRLDRVATDIESGRVAGANLRERRPAIFLDRDGTLNIDHGFIKHSADVQLFSGAAEAVRRINGSSYLAVVVTNQPVVARGECTENELEQIHARLEELLGEGGGYVDRIYYCPHHPAAGFPNERSELKFKCDCRKPETGMILKAAEDNSIDLSKSFIVGDTTADFLLAKRLGLRSVGVATGFAGLDGKYPVEPDYSLPDIESAVSFILDVHPVLVGAVKPLAHVIERDAFAFVGGVARGGKSTIAHMLAECLSMGHRTVHVVALDRWIRSRAERKPGVFGRYDMDEIELTLTKLAPPRSGDVTLDLPFYFRKSQTSLPHAQTLTVKPEDAVIVEGTIALLCAPNIPGRRIYVESARADRRERFMHLQRLRGKAPKEAEDLFAERENEETVSVARSKRHADTVVTFIPPFQIEITGR